MYRLITAQDDFSIAIAIAITIIGQWIKNNQQTYSSLVSISFQIKWWNSICLCNKYFAEIANCRGIFETNRLPIKANQSLQTDEPELI